MPDRLHLLSFDLEEWFYLYSGRSTFDPEPYWRQSHLRAEKILQSLLQLLSETKSTATFFCMGRFARQYPSLIRNIQQAGHELGAHSDVHTYARHQSPSEFEADLERNLHTLEDLIGQKLQAYRTPAYSVDTSQEVYQDIFQSLGICFDSSMKAGSRNRWGKVPNRPFYSWQHQSILNLPVSTYTYLPAWPYAGSGFFRVSPSFLMNQQLARLDYHMLYFHPRDFDPAMWHLPNSAFHRVKYGWGTTRSLLRLKALLHTYRMYSIQQASELRLLDPFIDEKA